ncbi:MAG: Na+/H+ antiporter NhaC family protein, partial [Lachnospiraceae bacterium]|nr:Na+/H+ antiporter NhaC family protein [Lachnospiraceae bacterium]
QAGGGLENESAEAKDEKGKGTVIDLVLPIIVLIISCVIGMIYTGGFFEGANFIAAFSDSDASLGLVLGSSIALIITILFYLVRGRLPFRKMMEAIPDGFKAMVPAILILTFAWTLKAMTDSLGAATYVETMVKTYASGFTMFIPAIIFVVACLLAFATGTSWGTFGILIPIVVGIFSQTDYTLMIISISACMAGAVCGDHCSPISDTTIMASAGAQCDHVKHVSTQMPYAITVAVLSFITYIIAGFVKNPVICLLIGIALTIGTLLVAKILYQNKETN